MRASIFQKRTVSWAVVAVLAAIAVALCFMGSGRAWADNIVTSPFDVSDDVTHVNVTKLDSTTHEYVQGAKMAIIDAESQEVVASWTTGSSSKEIDKVLNVDTPYILREVQAPNGYDRVDDVYFYVNASETEGITITGGTEGQYELTGQYAVALYDNQTTTENVVTVTKASTNGSSKVVAPKTGDETRVSTVAWAVAAGVVVLIVLEIVKRRMKE